MAQPLELEPEVGDIYELSYLYSGQLHGATGTKSLRQYYRGVDQISLIRVSRDSSHYYVKLRVDQPINNPEPIFDVPGFKFEEMKEVESVIKRIISTVMGILMGGGA